MTPVIDLHCDILDYLQYPNRTFRDPHLLCNFEKLIEGNVALQVLAIFTQTDKGSSERGLHQLKLFSELEKFDSKLHILHSPKIKSKKCNLALSIENLSSFVEEDEYLNIGLERLCNVFASHEVMYVSLTWNHENRFGGGQPSGVGLKPDGKEALQVMSEFGVPLDLSHASDALANECLEYIDQRNLNIRVLASHSNFRAVTNHLRNLPDSIAKEIIRRNGIIGMNFARSFIGKDDMFALSAHLEHGLSLGAEKNLALGIDIFDVTVPTTPPKNDDEFRERISKFYYEDYCSADIYPKLEKELASFGKDFLKRLFFQNALQFYFGLKSF